MYETERKSEHFAANTVYLLMEKVLAISITGLMFLTGMKVSIGHHYCGGKAAATKLSVTAVTASCGMEEQEHSFSFQTEFGSVCCEDQLISYGINNIYIPEYFRLTHPSGKKKLQHFQTFYTSSGAFDPIDPVSRDFPPGKKQGSEIYLFQICILRI